MSTCQFPNCKTFVPEGQKYCIGHAKIMSVPRAEKKKQPVAKRSAKLKKEMRPYKKEVKAFLSQPGNNVCKIQAKGCTGEATCVHHIEGRTGKKLRDQNGWIPSCGNCNGTVEVNDLQARMDGHKKSRLTNSEKRFS